MCVFLKFLCCATKLPFTKVSLIDAYTVNTRVSIVYVVTRRMILIFV